MSIYLEQDKRERLYRWDEYFLGLCNAVANKSPCMSRKIGAILVRDHSILSTGYNGPPRGISHCGAERLDKDADLRELLEYTEEQGLLEYDPLKHCPRRCLGYPSGKGLELCPAGHAERNCIVNAARVGVAIRNSSLYLNTCIPCKDCMIDLINAGVIEIVVTILEEYDREGKRLLSESGIILRKFSCLSGVDEKND